MQPEPLLLRSGAVRRNRGLLCVFFPNWLSRELFWAPTQRLPPPRSRSRLQVPFDPGITAPEVYVWNFDGIANSNFSYTGPTFNSSGLNAAEPAGLVAPNTYGAAEPGPLGGPATFSLTNPTLELTSLSFYLGSLDTYNTISFYDNGSLVTSFTGTQLAAPAIADGDQGAGASNRRFFFSFGLADHVNKVVFNFHHAGVRVRQYRRRLDLRGSGTRHLDDVDPGLRLCGLHAPQQPPQGRGRRRLKAGLTRLRKDRLRAVFFCPAPKVPSLNRPAMSQALSKVLEQARRPASTNGCGSGR